MTRSYHSRIAFGLCDLGLGFPEPGCVSLDSRSLHKVSGNNPVVLKSLEDNRFQVLW